MTPPSDRPIEMQANRRTLGTRAVAATLILLAFSTLVFALSRQDVLMIALGLLLAASSMELLRR